MKPEMTFGGEKVPARSEVSGSRGSKVNQAGYEQSSRGRESEREEGRAAVKS